VAASSVATGHGLAAGCRGFSGLRFHHISDPWASINSFFRRFWVTFWWFPFGASAGAKRSSPGLSQAAARQRGASARRVSAARQRGASARRVSAAARLDVAGASPHTAFRPWMSMDWMSMDWMSMDDPSAFDPMRKTFSASAETTGAGASPHTPGDFPQRLGRG
jgi:hypothetical protein